MLGILLNQNVCMYVMIVCGCIGLIGRAVMNGYLAGLARASERMGTTKKKALYEMKKRYEDMVSLDAEVHDVAAFVDKYIDRLKIGFVPVRVWNGFVKNMGVIAAGTGIFAAAYQYYVVGDGMETVKMLLGGLATCLVLLAAHNQLNCSWHMQALRDSARNYLGNSLTNRLKKEVHKQMSAETHMADTAGVERDRKSRNRKNSASVLTACSRDGGEEESGGGGKNTVSDSAYDALLDKMMQKILTE